MDSENDVTELGICVKVFFFFLFHRVQANTGPFTLVSMFEEDVLVQLGIWGTSSPIR